MKSNLVYIWLDGYTPTQNMRSKTKVVEDFDLSYNIGTATTYLLRAKRKHETSVDCIQKAINHLEFELDKIKNEK